MESKQYDLIVQSGKKLYIQLKNTENELYRLKKQIAKLALEVCDIRHGGISGNRYTLLKFANDTGIPVRTVSDWVRIFKLSKILDVDINSDENWRRVDYVSRKRGLIVAGKNISQEHVRAKAPIEKITDEEKRVLKNIYKKTSSREMSKNSEDVTRMRGLSMLVKYFQSNLINITNLNRNDLGNEELKHLKHLLEKSLKSVNRAIEIEKN